MPIRLTPTVKVLAILNLAVFLLQHTLDRFFGSSIGSWIALTPADVVLQGRIWQLVTYAFAHADVTHLFLNLLMLVFIGSDLEAGWGRKRFLRYYLVCAISAGFFYLAAQLVIQTGLHVPMVGASGAIYGLLVAYGLIFGERVLLFMMLFPMKAKQFIWILAAVEFMTTLYSPGGGFSSIAHLSGMAAGFIYLFASAYLKIRKRRIQRGPSGAPSGKKNPGHLKLVIDNVKHFDTDEKPKTWH